MAEKKGKHQVICLSSESEEEAEYKELDDGETSIQSCSEEGSDWNYEEEADLESFEDSEDYDDDDDAGGVASTKVLDSEASCNRVIHLLEGGCDLQKVKVVECKAYLRKHGLRLTGNKAVCIQRIKEHWRIKDGKGEELYPRSSFVINCTGDACTGDVVLFTQRVHESYGKVTRVRNLLGKRTVAGRIVKESYGAAKQQHTFTVEVLWNNGFKRLPPMFPLLVKGRNLYRMKTFRQQWGNEEERSKVLDEKHGRGAEARRLRAMKGGNLYRMRTFRQQCENEEERSKVHDEKHGRGAAARHFRAMKKTARSANQGGIKHGKQSYHARSSIMETFPPLPCRGGLVNGSIGVSVGDGYGGLKGGVAGRSSFSVHGVGELGIEGGGTGFGGLAGSGGASGIRDARSLELETDGAASVGLGGGVKWSSFFSKDPPDKEGVELHFAQPVLKEGKSIVCPSQVVNEEASTWNNTLIGHFIGWRPHFQCVKSSLEMQWKVAGTFEANTLENGLIFCFSLEEDMRRILESGPWSVQKSVLILRPWSPNSSVKKINLSTVPIWVCLPNLPLQFWSVKALSIIATGLGKPLYTDRRTMTKERLAFARFYVEISAESDFPNTISISTDGGMSFDQEIRYEWRPPRCPVCRVFGHSRDQCRGHGNKVVRRVWKPKFKGVAERESGRKPLAVVAGGKGDQYVAHNSSQVQNSNSNSNSNSNFNLGGSCTASLNEKSNSFNYGALSKGGVKGKNMVIGNTIGVLEGMVENLNPNLSEHLLIARW